MTKIDVSADKKSVICERDIEGGKETVESPLPCVVTSQKGLNEPGYASLPGIMKAKKKPVEKKSLSDLGFSPETKLQAKNYSMPSARRRARNMKAWSLRMSPKRWFRPYDPRLK